MFFVKIDKYCIVKICNLYKVAYFFEYLYSKTVAFAIIEKRYMKYRHYLYFIKPKA
jgi:hypothetical protein